MVEELNFAETLSEDDRGLKPGLDAAPGPRWLGRRGAGENDLFWGDGGPESRSSHILTASF